MPEALSSPLVAIPALLVTGFCLLRSLSSWVSALQLLIAAILFGGILGAWMGSGALPVAFRDLAIVAPLYLAFFLGKAGRQALARVPLDLGIGLAMVLGWLIVGLFNLGSVSMLQLLIGLKVWGYYVPFLVVGIALATRPPAMFRVFRTFLLLGIVACGIGLVQSFLIRVIGYGPAISLFFGTGANAATQGFTFFTAGGGIFRVPGTFSFNSQYVGFLYVLLTVAMIETNADPDPWYRRIANLTVFVTLLASVVSGTKGALVTFPLFVVGYALFGLTRSGLLVVAPVALAAGVLVLTTIGIDLGGLFRYGAELTRSYTEGFFFQQIDNALQFGALGRGIGSNTNAARYAIPGTDVGSLVGFESYFAKIAVELGAIGLVILGTFLAWIGIKSGLLALRYRFHSGGAIVAPLAIYVIFTLVTLFKAWSIDVDPANVFFWLALGLMVGIDRQTRGARVSVPEAAPLLPGGSRPAPLG